MVYKMMSIDASFVVLAFVTLVCKTHQLNSIVSISLHLCPDVSLVLDYAQEYKELFHILWQSKCKNWVYFFWLWFDTISG